LRVKLAKTLLRIPDEVLLDKSTKHLYIKSIEWMEGFLINYTGAVVLVRYDREFPDHVTKMKKNFFFLIVYSTFVNWIKKQIIEKFFSI
jgi:ATPase subunit of ABC transporter with duplicated ATPase domains